MRKIREMYLKDYMKQVKRRKRGKTWNRVKEKLKCLNDIRKKMKSNELYDNVFHAKLLNKRIDVMIDHAVTEYL